MKVERRAIISGALIFALGIWAVFALKRIPNPRPEGASSATTLPASSVDSRVSHSESSAAAASGAAGSLARLRELEKKALEALPRVSTLSKKPEHELHDTPAEIVAAGRVFGKLAEFLAGHPERIRDALPTYRSCAGDPTIVPAIRALCTFRLSVYEKDWDPETRTAFGAIPEPIRELARELEGT